MDKEIGAGRANKDEDGEGRKKKMGGVWLRDRTVRELVRDKHRLVQVPYTATLADTVNALVANDVIAVPIAAPPGRWIGAGGSMILESDRITGLVRKQYIGMVTMLDVLVHIAEEVDDNQQVQHRDHGRAEAMPDLEEKMLVPVSSVIGHSLEGLSLWTLNPNTSILDCMETFSKGVHRALVPLESHTQNVIAAELTEVSPGYRMLTQMDVLIFLKAHANELKDIISCSIGELGAVNNNVFAVTESARVIEAIKSMRALSLNAVPIVEAPGNSEVLEDGKGRRLVSTFSATDLRGCSVSQLQSWLSLSVVEFKERVSSSARARCSSPDQRNTSRRKLNTCCCETSLAKVIEEVVDEHVHRVWVVDQHGLLMGLVSLTDMLRVIREAVLQVDHELREVLPPSIS